MPGVATPNPLPQQSEAPAGLCAVDGAGLAEAGLNQTILAQDAASVANSSPQYLDFWHHNSRLGVLV